MQKAICVYSSSSDALAPHFFDAATQLGALIAANDYALVYGGARVGLMGAVARSVHEQGGKVIGVVPGHIHAMGITYDIADELIITNDLRERKAVMEERADAFVGLPGGFGTLEELLEILTLKQLRVHAKPVVLVNTEGFYDPLVHLFEHIYEHRFARPESREMYHLCPDPAGVFTYLAEYTPPLLETKWFYLREAQQPRPEIS